MKGFILLISFLSVSAISAQGLKAGNNYKAHILRGNMNITCDDGRDHRSTTVNCRGNYLAPTQRSKFVTGIPVDADKVVLTYKDHRGRTKSKRSTFYGDKGESKREFNLWIGSLLQRPMLNSYGENKINFSLSKNGEEVANGEFIVNVEKLPTRTCGYASYRSSNMSDCNSNSNYCARYFRDQDYCR